MITSMPQRMNKAAASGFNGLSLLLKFTAKKLHKPQSSASDQGKSKLQA